MFRGVLRYDRDSSLGCGSTSFCATSDGSSEVARFAAHAAPTHAAQAMLSISCFVVHPFESATWGSEPGRWTTHGVRC